MPHLPMEGYLRSVYLSATRPGSEAGNGGCNSDAWTQDPLLKTPAPQGGVREAATVEVTASKPGPCPLAEWPQLRELLPQFAPLGFGSVAVAVDRAVTATIPPWVLAVVAVAVARALLPQFPPWDLAG